MTTTKRRTKPESEARIVLELTPRQAHALLSACYAADRNHLVEIDDVPFFRDAKAMLERRIHEFTSDALKKPVRGSRSATDAG